MPLRERCGQIYEISYNEMRTNESRVSIMIREKILSTLKSHIKDFKRFHVASLAIFGSVARDDDGPDSDVDVLVRFEGQATFDLYMELKFYLEDLCKRKVDLVSEKALKPNLKKYIERDLVHVT